jgi:hypothetical protein
MTKYLKKTTSGRKDLFWLLVSEFSIHAQRDPLLLVLQQGRNIMAEGHGSAVHFLAVRKLRVGELRTKSTLEGTPPVIYVLYLIQVALLPSFYPNNDIKL